MLIHCAEGIVNLAFDHVTQIYNTRFGVVISQGAFADLVVCLTEFSKNLKFQKRSLQAIETLKSTIPRMLKTPECPLSRRTGQEGTESANSSKQPIRQTQEEQYWFPVLFAFHDVLMTGDDLEVRSRYVHRCNVDVVVNLTSLTEHLPTCSKLLSNMEATSLPSSGISCGGNSYIRSSWC